LEDPLAEDIIRGRFVQKSKKKSGEEVTKIKVVQKKGVLVFE